MSMLAEPKKKKRYNLVPRGKALYEDENRFGTKMLKKMGWSQGSGLGSKENGSTEFVRVRYKNDAEGLGYQDRNDHWTQHETEFNGLLRTLNGETEKPEIANNDDHSLSDNNNGMVTQGLGFNSASMSSNSKKKEKLKDKVSGESLEEKSKNSRARVHYKKFTQGKDLSRYSEKDLANIFGKKVDGDAIEPVTTPAVEREVPENFAGVQTCTTGVSVGDYFKQKMENIKKKFLKNSEHSVESSENFKNEQEDEQEDQKMMAIKEERSEEAPKEKKKKKTKKETDDKTCSVKSNEKDVPENLDQTEKETVIKKTKKKSKRKPNAIENDQQSESNPAESIDMSEELMELKKCEHLEEIREGLAAAISETENLKVMKKKKSKMQQRTETKECIQDDHSEESICQPQMKKQKCEVKEHNSIIADGDKYESPTPIEMKLAASELEKLNTYTISKFAADKFALFDFGSFKGSNLNQINGYGFDEDMKLEIVESNYDDRNIRYLWDETLNNKYKYATPKHEYIQYANKVREAYQEKTRMPKLDLKKLKRKNVFYDINKTQ